MTIYELLGYSKNELTTITDNIENYYLSFPIKKSNGKLRWIDAPQATLKAVQHSILTNLVYKFKTHNSAFGFVRGRSVKDCAQVHIGAKVLLCADISDFFYSIKLDEIYRLLTFLLNNFSKGKIVYSREDMEILVKLVSYKKSLPQGSPVSPALANLFCFPLDKQLLNLAEKNKLTYTRYADDLSFSTNDSTFLIFKIIPEIATQLRQFGLKMNPSKTRILRPHRRMVVTGVVINKKLGTPKWVWKNIKAELHNLNKNKITITAERQQKLRGKIEWIRTLHPIRGNKLLAELGKIVLSRP